MKIKVIPKKYQDVLSLPEEKHLPPKKPNVLFRTLLKLVSLPDLWATRFKCTKIGMEELEKGQPCLYLMNHSSFIDLEIAASVLYPRPFNIVATTDSFVGKGWLMRQIGCIPTKKFVTDLGLIRDMSHTVKKLKSSVVMFPEAGYSLDGTTTTLPDTLGRLCKMLDVPVVMICTYGAFARDPLYNNLQKRKVKVSADMRLLLTREELKKKTPEEINAIIRDQFDLDYFKWQQENGVEIAEPFRADYLNRALYKCPHCSSEGNMVGKGIHLTCGQCGFAYELDKLGFLRAVEGEGKFTHVPDWFPWQRKQVRREVEEGSYRFESPVRILMSRDLKNIYDIGKGQLTHTPEGFHLVGAGGALDYTQNPQASYSVNSDFYWYEIGDVICIGNQSALYYCFPRIKGDVVAKVRLAAEEMFKLYVESKNKEKLSRDT